MLESCQEKKILLYSEFDTIESNSDEKKRNF